MSKPIAPFSRYFVVISILLSVLLTGCGDRKSLRQIKDFNQDWKFNLGDVASAEDPSFHDDAWRSLQLPHDWSIEGNFDEKNPSGVGGGALPGGIGWYRKTFMLSKTEQSKKIFIQFDGVYRNSEVWINGHSLGIRPNGYISFQYELTSFLLSDKPNVIAVRVDNSKQPNSRWYSGSGIFRDVKLIVTNDVFIPYIGTFIRATEVTGEKANLLISTQVKNSSTTDQSVTVINTIYAPDKTKIAEVKSTEKIKAGAIVELDQEVQLDKPQLWSLEDPARYKAMTTVEVNGNDVDEYETIFGVRSFNFDVDKGFSLNDRAMKINGVCLHHDQGCLGTAFNRRAGERQLEIMRGMGVNAIRTSHNPPSPEFLDLCDSMGFIVMDEMFDMWKRKKTEFDYSLDWDEWHERDLEDFIKRDRNHPSVMIWSIGNEIGEQWDSTGTPLAKELAAIVRSLDTTRPITTANNEINNNHIIKSGALDLIGYNYNHKRFAQFPKEYPNQKFIATETVSGLATRGHYDMPSDSVRRWPISWDKVFTEGNPDNSVSAYDNVSAPWGSTQEETLKEIKKYDFLSGQFIWTGFDYIGEPTPYVWPSKSSYFGIVDLAGFPKDVYYLYQSEWTDRDVLHIFPHWNWKEGQIVDVWAYYNHADEVELFLNGVSQGVKKKTGDDMHVMWTICM
jgi:beta-galactosidase